RGALVWTPAGHYIDIAAWVYRDPCDTSRLSVCGATRRLPLCASGRRASIGDVDRFSPRVRRDHANASHAADLDRIAPTRTVRRRAVLRAAQPRLRSAGGGRLRRFTPRQCVGIGPEPDLALVDRE